MELYISGRGFGKTMMLVREAAKNQKIIVVSSKFEVNRIKFMAKYLKMDIPDPIVFKDLFRHRKRNPESRYMIDNLECILQNLGVDVATIDRDPIKFLPHWGVPDGRTMKVSFIDEFDSAGGKI